MRNDELYLRYRLCKERLKKTGHDLKNNSQNVNIKGSSLDPRCYFLYHLLCVLRRTASLDQGWQNFIAVRLKMSFINCTLRQAYLE
jgi:hypothetical protein